jgi:hypothetical protein
MYGVQWSSQLSKLPKINCSEVSVPWPSTMHPPTFHSHARIQALIIQILKITTQLVLNWETSAEYYPKQLSGSDLSGPSLVNLSARPTILLHQNLPPSLLINGDSFSVGGFAPTICDQIATGRNTHLSCLRARRLEL